MRNKQRREVSAVVQMLSQASYWQKQIEQTTESLRGERDEWRAIARLFALAESPFDHENALKRFWEYTNKGER
jgi:hypothetical protein